MPRSSRLPARFPVDTKYVVEARGDHVRRYVEFPDGHTMELTPRKALTCLCADSALVPPLDAGKSASKRKSGKNTLAAIA
jgi:hypothetical protein